MKLFKAGKGKVCVINGEAACSIWIFKLLITIERLRPGSNCSEIRVSFSWDPD